MDVEHSSEIDFAAIYDPINRIFIQFLQELESTVKFLHLTPAESFALLCAR